MQREKANREKAHATAALLLLPSSGGLLRNKKVTTLFPLVPGLVGLGPKRTQLVVLHFLWRRGYGVEENNEIMHKQPNRTPQPAQAPVGPVRLLRLVSLSKISFLFFFRPGLRGKNYQAPSVQDT